MWYRTNTAEYFGDDGLAGRKLKIGPFGNVPVVFSTKWHSLPAYGAPSAVAIVLNRAYAIPFWPGRSTTITGVAAEVTVRSEEHTSELQSRRDLVCRLLL